MNYDTCIIIPVYNEAKVAGETIRTVLKDFPFVVGVNDGSRDNTAQSIAEAGAVVVSHPKNMGQGAALQTGLEFALQYPSIKYFVTFDCDGQHDIKDVKRMLARLRQGDLDVVLGSRFLKTGTKVPWAKKQFLKAAIVFTNTFSNIRLTDTHNGLRVFNRPFAEQLNISMPGMAHASEIIDKIGRGGWRYEELPVTIHYTDYSRGKGQSMLNSVNIVMDLLLNKARK